MRTRSRVAGFLCLVLVGSVLPALCTETQDPDLLNQIVSRMEDAQSRNRENYRPYILTRRYKLFDDEQTANSPRQKATSEVVATLEFTPPDHKTFQIEKVEGSDRGKSVVRRVLEGESGASGKPPAFLTRSNYEFKLVGEEVLDGQSCWVLAIRPLKDEKNTIKGRAWVDKSTYLVHEVRGEMAKSPSWWLKKVDMTIHYGEAAGMWLPTGTYAVADVRFFGKHVLTSQAVNIKTVDQSVRAIVPARPTSDGRRTRNGTLAPLVGTGIYPRR